ncbi:MAG: EAL domain-containing protein [Lachnospiraceae bacterium]|nr:EAL domain-containing protein [Lachnospiraceae bacterium]
MFKPTPDFYNYTFDFCAMAVFGLSAVLYFLTRGVKTRQNRIFLSVEVLGFFASLFDILGAYCIAHAHEVPFQMLYCTNLFYHLIHVSVVLMYSYYVMSMFNLHRRLHWTVMILFFSPSVIMAFIIVSTYWTRWAFYFDENLKYQHGAGMPLIYILSLLYLIVVLVIQIAFRKALSKGILVCVISMILAVVFAVIFQSIRQEMLIELFVESMAMLCFIFATESSDDIYDKMSGIKNSTSFMKEMNIIRYTHSGGTLIVLKISSVSFYHSKLGTSFRNNMSRQIALWFKTFLKEEEIYSLGAGHFAVILMGNRAGMVDDVYGRIKKRFAETWDFEKFTVKLVVQIMKLDLSESLGSDDDIISLTESPFEGSYDSFSESGMDDLGYLKREREVQDAMSRAFSEKLFKIYLQPIYNLALQRVDSAEALVRIDDPVLGLIMPTEFIPAAERSGLIMDIGIWVIRESCRFYRDAALSHFGIDRININLSEIQFLDTDLPERILGITEEYGVDPSRICFEITSTMTSGRPEKMREFMVKMREYGFCFALDNYGLGYSIKPDIFDLPFTMVKIDKSILWAAQKNKYASIEISGSVRMLQEMQLKTVIEGVESTEHMELLESLSVDYLQGYYFSKPLEEMRFMAYINAAGAL